MKKIILFTDNLGSGGAQRQVANVAVLLKKARYDVSVLVYQDNPFYKHILDDGTLIWYEFTRKFYRRHRSSV